VFVWLEYDITTGRSELRALIDVGDYLHPIILLLIHEMLDVCVHESLIESMRHFSNNNLGRKVSASMLSEEKQTMKEII